MILDSSYATKTIDDLRAELFQLATDLAAISDKRTAIFALIEKRKADAAAAVRVSRLSVVERDALKHALELGVRR